MTLWQLYADNQQVATSLRDVESLRNQATNLGVAVSVAAFGLNEVARLTLRSRKSVSCCAVLIMHFVCLPRYLKVCI